MYYQVISGTVLGVEGILVRVEADCSNGMPYFTMVGYLSSEVKEAKERVIAALRAVSFTLPPKRITINLSPADLRKAGSSFDFPIALAILGSFELFPKVRLKDCFLAGELSLEGILRPVKGLLPMILEAKRHGIKKCYVPKANEKELIGIQGVDIYLVSTLSEMLESLKGRISLPKVKTKQFYTDKRPKYPDFSEVKGQYQLKRALEIAAAGRHNVLMIGPAGSGKSMLARCLLGVIPPLEKEELQEVYAIYSARGMGYNNGIYPPVRNPHHTVSPSAFLGGGVHLNAGEITLAHHGILLLDELAEFKRNCLEGLREPMENQNIAISRSGRQFLFPSDIMVVATTNPCPCGYYPDREKCKCTPMERSRYRKKISRPLMERFDMILWAQNVDLADLEKENENSKQIAKRILYGRNRQKIRYKKEKFHYNSRIPADKIEEICKFEKETKTFVNQIFHQKELSMREFHHMLKVALTIADMEGSDEITIGHIAEASSYYCREEEVR
ncbi:MAG: YifB family Mg chelatase-like AAA ATPase [Lachnospiraceae bacterium]|nr:YifB family Mg chelatase-like AAA ATPase [Lachnospiraceae bacterium]